MPQKIMLLLALSGLYWIPCAQAYPAQVIAPTPLLLRVNGKVVNGPTIPKGKTIDVISVSPSGGFVQTDFAGKRGWINAKAVHGAGGANRRVASGGESHTSVGAGSDSYSVAGDLALHGDSVGVGFGVLGFYNTPWSNGQWRFDVGPAFYYYPSAGASGGLTTGYSISVFEIMGLIRGMYALNATMEVGGQVGMVYEKINLPDSIIAGLRGTTLTTSAIGFTMGGTYTWRFAHDWRLKGDLRLLVASSSTYLFTAGAEYRF